MMKLYFPAVVSAVVIGATTLQAQSTASPSSVKDLEPGEVALIGCLQREADYRAVNNQGPGGALGTKIGTGNEYVLVKASPVGASATGSSSAIAARDFSLTGRLEKDLAREVGRMVEVVGTIKEDEGLPRLTVSLSHAVGDFCPSGSRP